MSLPYNNLYAVVLAGGEGTRFYPLSTSERPKQFLNFIGNKSFIRQTFERILPLVPPERIYVSTNERYTGLVREELPEVPEENIIGEPCKKNTAPALIYTTVLIKSRHALTTPSPLPVPSEVDGAGKGWNESTTPSPLMPARRSFGGGEGGGEGELTICCLPSDHYIKDEEEFRRIILQAVSLAGDGYLVTLGMKPTWASTDYGYIKPDAILPLCKGEAEGVESYRVSTFTEKPKKELAEEYIKEGYLWNGGIFVWRTDTLLNEAAKHAPQLSIYDSRFTIHDYFSSAPSISIDYAIMEKSDKVAVIPADIGWSDVGSWENVDRLLEKGADVSMELLGIMKGDERCPWRRIVPKPWGHEEWWAHTDRYVGKILFIKKGGRLSLQYHSVKEETLRLLTGELELELAEGNKHTMKHGDVYHIPPATLHRMAAKSDCLVLEVSTPEVDDVIRVSDDYGRVE